MARFSIVVLAAALGVSMAAVNVNKLGGPTMMAATRGRSLRGEDATAVSFCSGTMKPGDVVETVSASPSGATGLAKGAKGVVVCNTTTMSPHVLVCWDSWAQGHHNYGYCQNPQFPEVSCGANSGWFVDCSEIQLVNKHAPFTWVHEDGAFLVKTLSLDGGAAWQAGVNATVTMTGSIPTKSIVAGTLKWKLYETYVQHFVAEGFSPYFTCTNKGCDPSQPIALDIKPDKSFTLTVGYTMPESHGKGGFNLVLWGEDQDHTPYDFTATVSYNYTTSAL